MKKPPDPPHLVLHSPLLCTLQRPFFSAIARVAFLDPHHLMIVRLDFVFRVKIGIPSLCGVKRLTFSIDVHALHDVQIRHPALHESTLSEGSWPSHPSCLPDTQISLLPLSFVCFLVYFESLSASLPSSGWIDCIIWSQFLNNWLYHCIKCDPQSYLINLWFLPQIWTIDFLVCFTRQLRYPPLVTFVGLLCIDYGASRCLLSTDSLFWLLLFRLRIVLYAKFDWLDHCLQNSLFCRSELDLLWQCSDEYRYLQLFCVYLVANLAIYHVFRVGCCWVKLNSFFIWWLLSVRWLEPLLIWCVSCLRLWVWCRRCMIFYVTARQFLFLLLLSTTALSLLHCFYVRDSCCIVLLNWCRFSSFVLSCDPHQSKDCVYFRRSVILTKFCGHMCRIAKPRLTIQLKIIIVFPPIEQPSYRLQSIVLDLDEFQGLQSISCCAVGLLSPSVFFDHHIHYSSFWWVLVYWLLGFQVVQLLMGFCGAGFECWYSSSRMIIYVGGMVFFFKYKDLDFMAVHLPFLTPNNCDPSLLYWFSLNTFFNKFCAARGKWVESASGRADWTSVGPFVGEQPWLIAPVCSSHFPHDSSLILSSSETFFLIFWLSVDSAMLWFWSSGADLLYSLLGSVKQYTVGQKPDLAVHSELLDNYRCTHQFFGFALVEVLLIGCMPVGFMQGWFSTFWSLCWAVFCRIWPSNMRMGLCLTMIMPWIWLTVCIVYILAMWIRVWGALFGYSCGYKKGCVPGCVPHRSVLLPIGVRSLGYGPLGAAFIGPFGLC